MFCWYALTTHKQHHFGYTHQVFLKVLCRTNPKKHPRSGIPLHHLQSRAGRECCGADHKEEFFEGLRNPMQIHRSERNGVRTEKKKHKSPLRVQVL